MDLSSLLSQLKELQGKLVSALQEEYFCEDLEPPAKAFGWEEARLRQYFETGGDAVPARGAPAPVVSGQPGGGRVQPAVYDSFVSPLPREAPGLKALVGGDGQVAALRYQEAVIAAGIPDLAEGLFPPDDPLIKRLSAKYKPYIKALACPTADGGVGFHPVETGWVVGNNAAAHGIDLRLFISPGSERKLWGALRYSDNAMIGRGFQTSIHGGAVETALDEATAECAKAKLFPVATTVKIEFKIGKRVMPQVSYLIECEVTKEWSVNLKYDVSGSIKEADGSSTLATCVAVMANPAQIPGAGYE